MIIIVYLVIALIIFHVLVRMAGAIMVLMEGHWFDVFQVLGWIVGAIIALVIFTFVWALNSDYQTPSHGWDYQTQVHLEQYRP